MKERNHWVATSYLEGEVQLYDSKFNGSLTASLKEQLVQIYRLAIKNDGLIVTSIPVQQQTGSVDCELFAVAFAYHAALGDNMRTVAFKQSTMRQHFIHCLESQQLDQFPPADHQVKRNKLKHFFIALFCICKLPESYDDQMIECEKCQLWFHFKCMNIDNDNVPDVWLCYACMQ